MAYVEVWGNFVVKGTAERPVEFFPSNRYHGYEVRNYRNGGNGRHFLRKGVKSSDRRKSHRSFVFSQSGHEQRRIRSVLDEQGQVYTN